MNRLDNFKKYLKSNSKRMLGYPANLDYQYSDLYDFFKYSINNIGDPLSDGMYKSHAHEFEKEVVEFFAELTGISDHNFWGYVTNGGTEGNMYGLYIAREMYPESIVYYSKEAHYSIPKILKLLKLDSVSITSNERGEMCINDLETALQYNRTKTPIILATIGTTMKGAIDPIDEIKALLQKMAFLSYYIHCDAALGGMIVPFCSGSQQIGLKHGIHSLSVSGHKMFGSPMPSGIVLAKKEYVDKVASSVEYIGALDTTLSGSRNGHSTLLLWYAINKNGFEGYKEIVQNCLDCADYLIEEFIKIGIKAWRNKYSITVVFPRPSEAIIQKWQIAIQGNLAHIITMPHVSKEQINQFINDLSCV